MNHQKLKCYIVLTDKIAKRVPDLVASLPRGEGYLVDQLKRAWLLTKINRDRH